MALALRRRQNKKPSRTSGPKPGSPNIVLLILFITMLLFGLLMVFDASYYLEGWTKFLAQLRWLALGLFVSIPFLFVDYKLFKKLSWPLMIFTIAALIYALLFGVALNGSTRWVVLPGNFQFQPGEIAKLAVVLFFSWFLSAERKKLTKREDVMGVRTVEMVTFFLSIGFICGLILASRDLGNAAIVGVVAVVVYFLSGTDFLHSAGTFFVLVLFGGLGGLAAFLEPYRLERVRTFLDLLLKGEIADPRDAGYQISQILIGIGGSGGVNGTGFGRSRQRLGYLVEETAYTDSIGAVILEELGFIKGVIFVLLYGFMLYTAFRVALDIEDRYGQLLVAGLSVWLSLQFVMHMAANLGLMPLTGLTLPFISYGGSSLVVSMIAMAIILNVSRFTRGQSKNTK